jgi:hypothetical protein
MITKNTNFWGVTLYSLVEFGKSYYDWLLLLAADFAFSSTLKMGQYFSPKRYVNFYWTPRPDVRPDISQDWLYFPCRRNWYLKHCSDEFVASRSFCLGPEANAEFISKLYVLLHIHAAFSVDSKRFWQWLIRELMDSWTLSIVRYSRDWGWLFLKDPIV